MNVLEAAKDHFGPIEKHLIHDLLFHTSKSTTEQDFWCLWYVEYIKAESDNICWYCIIIVLVNKVMDVTSLGASIEALRG